MIDDLAPLVGHRLAWGRRYIHILTIRDGGIVAGHEYGHTVSASTFYEHAICGRIQGGATRAMMIGGSREGAEKIHAEHLARLTEVYPEFKTPESRVPCLTCFSVYNSARAKALAVVGTIGGIPVRVDESVPKGVIELRDAAGNLLGVLQA